ncbi:MAG TPA: hypothetical protein VMX15_05120, partial [Candidatus Heimdallarchaeota archaeon]|nr:hypothetical protein [Candidatus Heimdallarchaeota archaeon]
MKSWAWDDVIEWLLQKCRDKKETDPDNPCATVNLTGPGSDSEPSGELIRDAIIWALKEGFCGRPKRGLVRI